MGFEEEREYDNKKYKDISNIAFVVAKIWARWGRNSYIILGLLIHS